MIHIELPITFARAPKAPCRSDRPRPAPMNWNCTSRLDCGRRLLVAKRSVGPARTRSYPQGRLAFGTRRDARLCTAQSNAGAGRRTEFYVVCPRGLLRALSIWIIWFVLITDRGYCLPVVRWGRALARCCLLWRSVRGRHGRHGLPPPAPRRPWAVGARTPRLRLAALGRTATTPRRTPCRPKSDGEGSRPHRTALGFWGPRSVDAPRVHCMMHVCDSYSVKLKKQIPYLVVWQTMPLRRTLHASASAATSPVRGFLAGGPEGLVSASPPPSSSWPWSPRTFAVEAAARAGAA